MGKLVHKILLIDDNEYDVQLMRDALSLDRIAQFHLTAAASLAIGLSMINTIAVDVILLNLNLPDCQGLETFLRVSAAAAGIPVVVLSAALDEAMALQVVQQGAQDYLVKDQSIGNQIGRAARYAIERAQGQAELRASEKRFRALIENSAEAICLVGPDGTIFYESPSAIKILGYEMEELIGHNALDFSHPDDLETNIANFGSVLQQPGIPISARVRYRLKDGSWRWMQLTANNLLHEADVQAVVLNYHDITKPIETEFALEESEARFRSYVENAPIALFVSDSSGMFLEVNHAAEILTGYSSQELLAKNILELVLPEYREMARQDLLSALQGESTGGEYLLWHASGAILQISVRAVLLDGQRLLGYCRNVTDQKNADALLRAHLQLTDVAEKGSLDDLLQAALDCAETLTHSQISYFHFIEPGQQTITLQHWSTRTFAAGCQVDPGRNHYPLDQAGVWTDCFYSRTPVIHDNYAALTNSKGLPAGHVPILRDLGIPILENGLVVAIIGVGNKMAPYSEDDVAILQELTAITMDMVARKRAEEALRRSEDRFAKTFHHSPLAFSIARADNGQFIDMNDAFVQLSGYTREELLKNSSYPLDLFIDKNENQKIIEILCQQGSVSNYELEVCSKTGQMGVILLSLEPIELDGEPHLLSVCLDITERKRMEQALRNSEEKFRKVFYTSPDAITISNLVTGRYYSVNREFVRLSGYSEEETINKLASDLDLWNLPEQRTQFMQRLQEHEEVINMEARFRVKSGAVLDGLISATRIELDRTPHIISIIRDISERKRMEGMLRKSELHYRSVVSNVPLVMFVINMQGIFTLSEGKGLTLLGLVPGQVVGQSAFEIYHDFPDIIEGLQRALNGESFTNQVNLNGIIFETLYNPIYTEDGLISGVMGIATDITEREQAIAGLKKRTDELIKLLDAARLLGSTLKIEKIFAYLYQIINQALPCDGLIVSSYNAETKMIRTVYTIDQGHEVDISRIPLIPLNPDGQGTQSRVIRSGKSMLMPDFVNQMKTSRITYQTDQDGTVSVYHHDKDDGIPRSAIMVPLILDSQVAGVLQVLSNQPNAHNEDHLRFIEALVYRVTSAMANAALFQQVQSELEERRRAEEEVRKLNTDLEQRVTERTSDLSRANAELERTARAKDEFLASMSHELRTPLNAILTLTESLEEGIYGPLAERQVKSLRTISESGHHLLNLINDILDLSKIEAGKLVLQPAMLEVEALCQGSLRLIRQLAQVKNQAVGLSIDPTVTHLKGDPRYLKQMLVNLLSNAVKFTPDGGQLGLEVNGDIENGIVHLTVWDTGIGIDPQQAHRLFRPFMQIDSGLSRQYGGTGLGLSLVYRMAELHGGGVSLTSTPELGSRFTISLPWDGPGKPAGTGPLTLDQVLDLKLALLIDDSDTAAEQIERYLGELGAQISVLSTGQPALERAVSLQPDVILLDIQLPDISGWDLLTMLKNDERTRAIPIIALTVVDEPARGMALGTSDYLVKPITRSRLRKALQKSLPKRTVNASQSSSGPTPLILIAEDNPTIQATYSDYLIAKGYRILLAANGNEALERARESHPDLILMDIQMPGMDGLEATRHLRADESFCTIPIVALTALAMPGDRERCLEAGTNYYLTKPVSLKQLAQTIVDQLHRRNQ